MRAGAPARTWRAPPADRRVEKGTTVNQHRFDGLTRSLASVPSRRDVLRGLAGAGLELGAARLPGVVAAGETRRKVKKARPNAFGCLDVGNRCKNADQCCSGLCRGKRGKRRCRAHNTEGCTAGAPPHICDLGNRPCTSSLGDPGFCQTTTGKAGYCAAGGMCHACTTDAECRTAQGGQFGPLAACVRCAGCTLTGGTACAGPKQIPGVSQEGSPARSERKGERGDEG